MENLHFAFTFIWIFCTTFTQAAFRLPSTLTPSRYVLQLIPNISSETYTGTVTITFQTSADALQDSLKSISLHKDISILVDYSQLNVTTNNQSIALTNTTYEVNTQVYTLHLQSAMTAGTSYNVVIPFSGTLRKDDIGLHIGSYNGSSYVAANFYPIYARLAFPCFDEPHLKAEFEVSITRLSSQFSVSSQEIQTQNTVPEGIQDVFFPMPKMSTHSLSIFVGDNETMEMLEVEVETGTTLKLWKPKQMEISFNEAPFKSFSVFQSYVEQLLQKPHPLTFLNFFVLPYMQYDVFSGYGVIFLKENIIQPYQGLSLQQYVNTYLVVLEQMLKQFFCNYLTPEWWSDIWLTEGLVTYFKYVIFYYVVPEYELLYPDQMLAVGIRQEALSLEDFGSYPLVESDIKSTDDILRVSWDQLKKYKGAAIYYMMDQSTSGLPTKTLVQDILSNQNQSTISTLQFLQMILAKNTSISYKDFSGYLSWFTNAGYPVVALTRSVSTFELTQLKQNINGLTNISTNGSVWAIPMTYTYLSELDNKWMKMTPKFWFSSSSLNSSTSAPLSDWMIFNIKSTGFYRVLYEMSNVELIQSQLKKDNSGIDPVNHAAVIDDVMLMAALGLLDYKNALFFLQNASMHSRYSPWISTINRLHFLKLSLYNQPEYNTFKDFVKELIQYPYNIVTFFGDTQEQNNVTLLRNLILPWACEFDVGDCMYNANDTMELISNKLTSTKAYLNVDETMCAAFRRINTKLFESFFASYKRNNLLPAYKYYIASGLGCVTEERLNMILDALLNEEIYPEDVETVLMRLYSIIENVDTVVNFIVDNASYVHEKYGKQLLLKVIKGIGSTIYSQAQLSKLSSLSSTDSLISSSVTYTTSIAKSRLSWTSTNILRLTSGLNTVMSKSSATLMKYNIILLIVSIVINFNKLCNF